MVFLSHMLLSIIWLKILPLSRFWKMATASVSLESLWRTLVSLALVPASAGGILFLYQMVLLSHKIFEKWPLRSHAYLAICAEFMHFHNFMSFQQFVSVCKQDRCFQTIFVIKICCGNGSQNFKNLTKFCAEI